MRYQVFTKIGENRLVLIGAAEEDGKGGIAVKLDALPVMGELLIRAQPGEETFLVVHEIAGFRIRNLTKFTDLYGQTDYGCQLWWDGVWRDLTVDAASSTMKDGSKVPFGRLKLKEVWDRQEAARGA